VERDAARLPASLPVLVLHGERDATAPLDGVRRIVRGHRSWQLAARPDGDHHLVLRHPTWVVETIRSFITAPKASGAGAMTPA
jgi:pimeloyl-ACP methyl ester carboxylesterase